MAGVGFELKRLFQAHTATGHIKAYSYSAIVTTGPFVLLAGMVLAIQMLFQTYGAGADELILVEERGDGLSRLPRPHPKRPVGMGGRDGQCRQKQNDR